MIHSDPYFDDHHDSGQLPNALTDRKALEKKDRAELLADIREMAEQLVYRTEITQPPSKEEYDISFLPAESQIVGYLPPGLYDNIGKTGAITDMRVIGTVNPVTLKSTLDIYFAIKPERNKTYIISCHPTGDTTHVEIIAPNDRQPIPGLDFPANQLKRMFASIFLRNKTGDYESFDKLDISDYETVTNILLALVKKSDTQFYTATTALRGNDGSEAFLSYKKANDTLDEVTIIQNNHDGSTTNTAISLTKPDLHETDGAVYFDDGFGREHRDKHDIQLDYADDKEALIDTYELLGTLRDLVPYYGAELMSTSYLEEVQGGNSDTYPTIDNYPTT